MPNKNTGILKPGMGVDLVFDLSSMTPVIKSSIIFDCLDNRMIVAQPRHRIHRGDPIVTMHISSLVTELKGKIRKGYPCKITRFIDDYRLANGSLTQALEIVYTEPLIEMNIRSAFRFVPGPAYSVMGKLIIGGKEYYSGTHFRIFDISITGLGILIPKKINKSQNPLLDIKKSTVARIGLLLKCTEETESIYTVEGKISIVRVIPDYNEINAYAGMIFGKLPPDDEDALNKFIHNGQLHEIRSLNRM